MSMLPMSRKCPKCKRTYSFNPDVGLGLFCPHCASMGMPPKSTLEDILRRNNEKKKK